MKAGCCYMDGIDLYTRFGVWITKGGYNELLSFPEMGDVDFNDWPEEDGIDADLDNPTLKEKECTISFMASNPRIDAAEFIYAVSQPGYHTFTVTTLGRQWRLRLLSQPENKIYSWKSVFSLKFSDDFPYRPAEYAIPVDGGGLLKRPSMYELDGVGLDRYGIIVLSGRNELLKSPDVKENLKRSIFSMDGVIYDADQTFFKAKETTFKCCLIAVSIERFWLCYTAFFNDLVKPGERQLYFDYTSEEYPCYYKKSSGFKILSLMDRVAVEFNLTLVFTSFRITETCYLLAMENGALTVTEDFENYIDTKYYEN